MNHRRFRVRLFNHVVGVSVYANCFKVDEESIIFLTSDNAWIACFDQTSVEKVLIGAMADEVAWENSAKVEA